MTVHSRYAETGAPGPSADEMHDPDWITKIAVVESHALFAESLEIVLGSEGYDAHRARLDPDGGSTAALLSTVLRMRPRLVLLGLDLGGYGSGVDLIRPLAEAGVVVVVVAGSTDQARWGQCIAHGAQHVISKGAPLSEVLMALRKVSDGRAMMSREERTELVEQWHRQRSTERDIRSRLDHLTRREAEVLGMLMNGMQVSEIAKAHFVCESTVRTHVKAILAKLQVSSQLAAAGLAHQAAWASPQAVALHAQPADAGRRLVAAC